MEEKERWNNLEDQEEAEERAKPRTSRQKKIEEDKKRLEWVKPIFDDNKAFRSKLAVFGSDKVDSSYLQMIVQPWDFTPSNIKKAINNRVLKREAFLQSFIPERLEKLGPDLATAHFVCFRKGKVRFKGHEEWTTYDTLNTIPNLYHPDYIIEDIAYDGIPLYYPGVENIRDLPSCKSISIKNSPYFDDWCLDRLSGNNLPSLETLDLRGATQLTHRSMGCIYRLTGLKKLLVTTNDTIEWKLSIAMLEEMNTNLNVINEVLGSVEEK